MRTTIMMYYPKERVMRYQLNCPKCRRRLIDTDDISKSRVETAKLGLRADYYLKCRFCKNEIAIHKTT